MQYKPAEMNLQRDAYAFWALLEMCTATLWFAAVHHTVVKSTPFTGSLLDTHCHQRTRNTIIPFHLHRNDICHQTIMAVQQRAVSQYDTKDRGNLPSAAGVGQVQHCAQQQQACMGPLDGTAAHMGKVHLLECVPGVLGTLSKNRIS